MRYTHAVMDRGAPRRPAMIYLPKRGEQERLFAIRLFRHWHIWVGRKK